MINVLFMGRKAVAAKALKWLSDEQNVRVVAVLTDSHLGVSPTGEMAKELGIPLVERSRLEAQIDESLLNIDLGLSLLYWQRIRRTVLDACRLGVVNFHPAPLPDYKGTGGYNLAVLEGRTQWAVSAHYVDENIDTGEIIDVDWFAIDQMNETALSLEQKCQPKLLSIFKRTVSRILSAEERLPTRPNIGGRYISRAAMEGMKKIAAGDDVDRKIRAFWFPPYDGAYICIGDSKYTLVNRPILEALGDPSASSLFSQKSR